MTLAFKPFTVTDVQVNPELKFGRLTFGRYTKKYDVVKFLGSGRYAEVKGTTLIQCTQTTFRPF